MALIPDYRAEPLKAGLMWAVLFIPAFILINYLRDGALMPGKQLLLMVPVTFAAGPFWAYVLRWLTKGEGENAR